jgi:hypothetical protein
METALINWETLPSLFLFRVRSYEALVSLQKLILYLKGFVISWLLHKLQVNSMHEVPSVITQGAQLTQSGHIATTEVCVNILYVRRKKYCTGYF